MNKRFIVVVLVLIAAAAFAMSVLGGRWWTIEGGFEIGPNGSRQCFGGDCKPAGLGWVTSSERWMRLGVATWAGGLFSMLLLVLLAGTVAGKRIPRLLAKTTLVAIATATVAGAWFYLSYPGVNGATVDRGAWLFPIAVLCGAAGAIAVVRARPAAAAAR